MANRPINVEISLATDIFQAIFVLHNFLQRDCEEITNTNLLIQANQIDQDDQNEHNLSATSIRDKFAEYFVNEGQLSWQNYKI